MLCLDDCVAILCSVVRWSCWCEKIS
jgi:hypothetical protein